MNIQPASSRPYHRKIFHLLTTTPFLIMGFLIDTYIERSIFLIIVFILLIVILAVEIPRLKSKRINNKLFSKFSHAFKKHEKNKIVSSIWGPINLFYMTLLLSKPTIVSMLCLGCWSDPLAAIIGTKFGGKKNKTGRTWAGTIAFFGFTFVFTVLASFIVPFPINIFYVLFLSLLASLIERHCNPEKYFFLDDNFIVPLVFGLGMELGLYLPQVLNQL